jgi:hypothetical protein
VRTTRIERRGLESERRTGISRPMEFGAAELAESVRVEEAFGGRTRSADAAARRAACRRRWGSSGLGVDGGGALEASFSAEIVVVPPTVDVNVPLLELVRAFSSEAFPKKYSARNRGLVPRTAALTLDVREKFLVIARDGCAVLRKHDRQMPLDRRRDDDGDRIIIACG